MGPEDALKKKIVDELLPPEALMDRAKTIVSSWMDTPGTPLHTIKAGVQTGCGRGHGKKAVGQRTVSET